MIVLIAPEEDIKDEISILNQLFEAGLEFYHLRKPNKSYEEHCEYLNQIDAKYHKRVVVHYFHELINEFELKGIHFQEQKRRGRQRSSQTLRRSSGDDRRHHRQRPLHREGHLRLLPSKQGRR